MRIAVIPKDERDKNFVNALKNKGVEVTLIDKNFICAKCDKEWAFTYSPGKNFSYATHHINAYKKVEEINLLSFDLILMRQNEILNEKDKFLFDTVEMLENEGVKVINPIEGIKISKDKYLAYYYLKKANLSIPYTYISNDEMRTYFQIIDLKYKKGFVFKPMSGKGGIGIVITKEKSTAGDVLSFFALNNKVAIFQKYIKNKKDMRIIVVGDEIIGGIERIAKKGMHKNGISIGGKAVAFKVNDELKEIAIKASNAVKCKISGVDIIEDEEEKGSKYKILEVNCSPGFDGFQKATKIDVYEKISEYLIRECKK